MWLLSVVAGCVTSNAVECGDRVCPANTTCDVERRRCIVDGELEACLGKNEGDLCEFGNVAGACYMGLCEQSTCGDNQVGPGEVCDDGNLVSMDGCRSDCRSDETCGNGAIDFQVGEECDCGTEGGSAALGCDATNSMTDEQATCRNDCKLRCGDSDVQPGEVCDGSPPFGQSCIEYGFDTGVLGCSDVCAPAFGGCEQFGWVSVDPGVASVELRAIWGADANHIFAVGMLGTILTWDGLEWTKMTVPPATSHLYGVWGRSATDVYAVGDFATVLHYDGTTWTAMATGLPTVNYFRAITGDAANLYIAGTEMANPPSVTAGIVARFNNNQWTMPLTPGTVATIDTIAINTSRSEVIVAGIDGDIFRAPLGSTSWTDVSGAATGKLHGSFATGTDVYVVGDEGLFKSTNGGNFVEVGTFRNLKTIWGTSASNMFVFGDRAHYWDGTEWSVASLSFVPNSGAWGTAADNVWSVGTSIRHFEGTTWAETTTGVTTTLNAITAGPPGVFAAGTQGALLRLVNGTWTAPSKDSASCGMFNGDLHGISSGTDIVAAIADNGTVVYATSSAGYGSFFCATTTASPTLLYDIWVLNSATDVFAVGNGSNVYRRRAGTNDWTAMPAIVWNGATPVPLPQLQTVWGFSASDIFAGGANGTIAHWNGTAWTQMTTGLVSDVTDLWGPAPNDVFAVGSNGMISHYNGTAWTTMTSDTNNRLEAVWGTSGTDVFATGGDTLLHYDGTRWLEVRDATVSSILDLVGLGPRIFGVGTDGGSELLLRF